MPQADHDRAPPPPDRMAPIREALKAAYADLPDERLPPRLQGLIEQLRTALDGRR